MQEACELRVQMLGGFSVLYREACISDQNCRHRKVLALLEYLIANRKREVSRSELMEVLWDDERTEDPTNALKTLVYRARSVLDGLGCRSGKELLQASRGGYHWNGDVPMTVDAEEFDEQGGRLLNQAETAEPDRLLAVLELYQGDFLPQSAHESWVMPLHTYHRSRYLRLVRLAIDGLRRAGRTEDCIGLCRKAIRIDPYEEELHISLISALMALGQQEQALAHYSHVTELFMSRFGVSPSRELMAQYKEIMRSSKSRELDLRLIREDLSERERVDGAFFCEYEFFKDVYRLYAREAARNGAVVCIALLTVMGGAKENLRQKKRNLAMDRLKETLVACLRRGDVCTRYSVDQFLLMLPTASYENAEMIMDRICRKFRQEYAHMNILLHFSILPMEPLM